MNHASWFSAEINERPACLLDRRPSSEGSGLCDCTNEIATMLYRVSLNLVCGLLLCALSSATTDKTETTSVTTCHTLLGTMYQKDPPRFTKHVTITATIPILLGPRSTTTITLAPSTARATITTTAKLQQTVPGSTLSFSSDVERVFGKFPPRFEAHDLSYGMHTEHDHCH